MSDWHNDPIKSTGFDAQIKHEDGYELHFYTDRLEAYRAVEKVCQEQIDRKPKTHGDELRAMTDEELAVTIMCPYDGFCVLDEEKADEYGCVRCTEDWLKQEVSE